MMWGPGFRRQLGVITNSNKISDLRFFLPLNSDINYIRPNLRVQTFDGENDYIDLNGFTFKNQSKFFINAWFKTTDITVLNKIFDESISTSASSSRVSLSVEANGSLRFAGRSNDTDSFTNWVQTDASTIELNTLYNVTANFDSTTNNHSLYINKVVNNATVSSSTLDNTDPIVSPKVGTRAASGLQSLFGELYEIVLGTDNLTSTEIGNIVDAGKNSFDWSAIDNKVVHYDLTASDLGVDQVKDLSGNGNHGTSFGKGEFTRTTPATFVDHNGIIGTAGTDVARFDGMRFINDDKGFSNKVGENAIVFDSANSEYVNLGNSDNSMFDVDGDFSFGIVVNIPKDVNVTVNRVNLIGTNKNGETGSLSLCISSGELPQFYITSNTPVFETSSCEGSVKINDGVNHFLIATRERGGTNKIYVDGALVGSASDIALTNFYTRTRDWRISASDADYVSSISDNGIIWNTALTPEQVMQQYLFSKKGSDYLVAPENVVGAWKLDDTTSTIIDYSGNGNDGTFYSGGSPATPTLVEGVYSSNTSIVGNGIMSYEAGTNLLTYSEELNNATGGWTESNVAVSLNQDTSPYGTLTADRIIPNNGVVNSSISKQATLTDNTNYNWSIFVKKNGFQWIRLVMRDKSGSFNTTWFDLDNVLVGTDENDSSNIESYGNGWYRCNISSNILTGATTPQFYFGFADADNTLIVTGDGSKYNIFWGAMLNEGTFPRPYIKTEATSVSTTADVCSYDVSDIITQSIGKIEGDIIIDGVNASATPVIFDLSDETVGNRIYAYINDSLQVNLRILTGGVEQALITSTSTLTAGTSANIKATYEDDNITLYLNGTSEGTDTSATIPIGLTTLNTGCDYNSANQLNGKVKNLKYSNKIN